jgi:ketopantoate reductase
MKIVVLGAEGLGSVLAAHLARAGEEVICIARGARAAFVRWPASAGTYTATG